MEGDAADRRDVLVRVVDVVVHFRGHKDSRQYQPIKQEVKTVVSKYLYMNNKEKRIVKV